MRTEVVTAVREYAAEGRTEFRASSIARRTGIPFDIARRDLVGLASSGVLDMKFAILCPETGDTLETLSAGTRIPETYSSWECCGGEEFDVTPTLVWVVFSPSTALVTDLATEATEAVSPPGKPTTPVSTDAGEDQLDAYLGGSDPPLVLNNYGTVYMGNVDDHSQSVNGGGSTGGIASSSGGSAGAGGSHVASERAAVATGGKASVQADVSSSPEKSPEQPRPRAAIATGVVALVVLVVAIGLMVGGVVSLAIGLALVAATGLALAAVAQITRRT